MSKKNQPSKPASSKLEKQYLESISRLLIKDAWNEAKIKSEEFISGHNDSAIAYFILALAAYNENDLTGSLFHAEKAVHYGADIREYAELLAIIYAILGDLNNSMYYTKIASTLPHSDHIIALGLPKKLPTLAKAFFQVVEDPLLKNAFSAIEQGRWVEAENWFGQHVRLNPGNRDANLGLANCLCIQGLFKAAVESLCAARHIIPNDAKIAGQLGTALTAVGAFSAGQASHRWAMSVAADDPTIHAMALNDLLLDPEKGTADIVSAFQQWGKHFGLRSESGAGKPSAKAKDILNVGYIIGAIGKKRIGSVLAKILAQHNPKRFRTVGFGIGRLSASSNIIFQKSFQTWHNINDMDPVTMGAVVTAEKIDILVNIGGFADPELLTAFGRRMAPVQASWLECPYGAGLENMDVIISDRVLFTDKDKGLPIKEKIAFMEHGGTLVDFPADDEGKSGAAHEKEEGLVFAADATLSELNPRTIEVWSRVLHKMPDSKLILMNHNFLRSAETVTQLVDLFGIFGVAHRVDILLEADSQAFFRKGDVCLLPFPARRIDVAADALWAGLPVVCLSGNGSHSREVASTLHYLGLGKDAVASTPEEFVELAVAWGENNARRKAFGGEIRQRLRKSPLADFTVRASDLESIYEELWQTAAG
ncbi:MAG: hypothetical protein A3G18_03070 [Rhodospirillales bacterium RIFCSPLOWO2_12_FULL_58_28]|nr:MAG: hypothetical protein A3H92_06485 [Rhodospirillales bacterium RIFCSPLOWO2_02_FULL_58_16]OHC77208.1 MAG: hypothetical protein A3G18_03070 [Rhodospirillales bacterium RIFCSPLOWO2_12_FULL_58_28]